VPRYTLAEPLVLASRWSRAGPAVPRRLLGTEKGRSSGIFGDILKESEEEVICHIYFLKLATGYTCYLMSFYLYFSGSSRNR